MKNNVLAVQMKKLSDLNDRTVRINRQSTSRLFGNLLTYAMLIALSVIFLVPFIYMVGGSLMSGADLADITVKWIPRHITWNNYRDAMQALNYWNRLLRSIIITGLCVFGQVLTSAFVGYGLGRVKFKLNGLVFGLVIFSMIIPIPTIVVGQYLMFASFGLTNTWLPIILPCFFALGLNGGLFVFLFRQCFRGMPKELENAAMIDGTGIFGSFFRVMLPCASSTILVVAILSMIWQWNNFFEPNLYLTTQAKFTLTMILPTLSQTLSIGSMALTNGTRLAGTVLCALPVILIFFVLQKRFIRGIETTGLAN